MGQVPTDLPPPMGPPPRKEPASENLDSHVEGTGEQGGVERHVAEDVDVLLHRLDLHELTPEKAQQAIQILKTEISRSAHSVEDLKDLKEHCALLENWVVQQGTARTLYVTEWTLYLANKAISLMRHVPSLKAPRAGPIGVMNLVALVFANVLSVFIALRDIHYLNLHRHWSQEANRFKVPEPDKLYFAYENPNDFVKQFFSDENTQNTLKPVDEVCEKLKMYGVYDCVEKYARTINPNNPMGDPNALKQALKNHSLDVYSAYRKHATYIQTDFIQGCKQLITLKLEIEHNNMFCRSMSSSSYAIISLGMTSLIVLGKFALVAANVAFVASYGFIGVGVVFLVVDLLYLYHTKPEAFKTMYMSVGYLNSCVGMLARASYVARQSFAGEESKERFQQEIDRLDREAQAWYREWRTAGLVDFAKAMRRLGHHERVDIEKLAHSKRVGAAKSGHGKRMNAADLVREKAELEQEELNRLIKAPGKIDEIIKTSGSLLPHDVLENYYRIVGFDAEAFFAFTEDELALFVKSVSGREAALAASPASRKKKTKRHPPHFQWKPSSRKSSSFERPPI